MPQPEFPKIVFQKIVLQFRSGCLIQNKSYVWMILQDTGWHFLCHWPLDHLENGVCFLVTIGKLDNLLGSHNGSNPHRNSLCRDLVKTGKETAIGFNGAVSQVDHMSLTIKRCTWLIKANMPITSDS